MVLLNKDCDLTAAWEFEAEVMILHHATTIKHNYQSVIHSGVIRQTARVIDMSKELLRTGDKGNIRFRFIKCPEYLHIGSSILFREGRTRGLGRITKIFSEISTCQPTNKEKDKANKTKQRENQAKENKDSNTGNKDNDKDKV